jgi:uncharacterized protein YfaP (DUF2135 family)
MKALSSITIILITTLSSFAVTASFEVKESSKANVFTIQYQSAQKGKVEVSILNSESEVIFKETINNLNTFVRPYNFSNLPEGIYVIMIEDEDGQHMETIAHSFEKKTVNFTQVTPIPNQDNKFWLNVYTTESETFNVRILSEEGDLLFEEPISVNGNYKTIYNLNKIKGNNQVTFEVTDSQGQLYTATF